MEKTTPINLNEKAHLFLTSSTGEFTYENGIITTNGFFKKNDFLIPKKFAKKLEK